MTTFIPASGWYAMIGVSESPEDHAYVEVRPVIAWECACDDGTRYSGDASGIILERGKAYTTNANALLLEHGGEWLIRYTTDPSDTISDEDLAVLYEAEVKHAEVREKLRSGRGAR